tara:strand:- start:36 stop:1175 length:1140 start_codon:yes stop_codon:yes gene_type:complete
MTTEKGVWNLQQVRDKQLQDAWKTYSGEQQLFTVGRNNFGNLGQNNRTDYSSPVQVTGTTWSEIYSGRGGGRALTLKTDGTLWTWGGTNDGASGLNSLVLYSSPVQIGSETTWGSIETYTNSSLAQKTDGTLWTWGGNERGQLGQNHTANRSSPIQIGSGTDWSENISAGQDKSGAVKTDGTLWVWGYNNLGMLGQNNRTSYSSPVQVPGTWSTSKGGLSVGSQTIAIKADGTLWAWGYGDSGTLGNNSTTWRSSPVQVGSDTTWAWIDAEYISAIGVKTDGTLWSWGYGNGGALGQNNQTSYSSPKQVGSGTDWSKAWSNEMVGAGLKTDGTAWVWGKNHYGQLGQNDLVYRSSPTQVPGNYKWINPNDFYYSFIKEL